MNLQNINQFVLWPCSIKRLQCFPIAFVLAVAVNCYAASTDAWSSSTTPSDAYVNGLLKDARRALSNGEYNLAIARCTTVINGHRSFFVTAYCLRSEAYRRKHQDREALSDAESAVRTEPSNPMGYIPRATLYAQSGNYERAAADLDRAIRLAPRWAVALDLVAWFKATCPDSRFRDGKKAVELATKACAVMAWRDPNCLDTLAASYAECGDFNQALKYQNQAIAIKSPDYSAKETAWLAEDMQKSLRSFENRKPFRDDFKWHH